jgi:hypothetical protein
MNRGNFNPDALRVLGSGVAPEVFAGGREGKEDQARRISRLRERSKNGDRESAALWMAEIIARDKHYGGRD